MKKLQNTHQSVTRRSGFTLLELLIVLAIILVIAAMVVPNLIGTQQGAMEKATMITIKKTEGTVAAWAADHDGTFFQGTGTDVWQALMQPEPYKGRKLRPYYEPDNPPLDAWDRPLQYEWTGDGHSKKQGALKPALWSMGANGQDEGGDGDDINSWTPATAASGK